MRIASAFDKGEVRVAIDAKTTALQKKVSGIQHHYLSSRQNDLYT